MYSYNRPKYPNETATGITAADLAAMFGNEPDRLFGRRFTYWQPADGCHVWQRDHVSGIRLVVTAEDPIRPADLQLTIHDPAGSLLETYHGTVNGIRGIMIDRSAAVIRRHGRQPETADRRLEPDRQIDPAAGDLADHYLMFAGCRRARARDRKRQQRIRDRQYSQWARQPETETAERGIG